MTGKFSKSLLIQPLDGRFSVLYLFLKALRKVYPIPFYHLLKLWALGGFPALYLVRPLLPLIQLLGKEMLLTSPKIVGTLGLTDERYSVSLFFNQKHSNYVVKIILVF